MNFPAILLLQLNSLELFLSQLFLPGFPFGDRVQQTISDSTQLLEVLYDAVTMARACVGLYLNMPPGEEFAMPDIGWLICSCGFSLAARFDVLAMDRRIVSLTSSLRKFLDMKHLMRQMVLRLEAVTSGGGDGRDPGLGANEKGEHDTFWYFLRRSHHIVDWYMKNTGLSTLSTPRTNIGSDPSSSQSSMAPERASVSPLPQQLERTGDVIHVQYSGDSATDSQSAYPPLVDNTGMPLLQTMHNISARSGTDLDLSMMDLFLPEHETYGELDLGPYLTPAHAYSAFQHQPESDTWSGSPHSG